MPSIARLGGLVLVMVLALVLGQGEEARAASVFVDSTEERGDRGGSFRVYFARFTADSGERNDVTVAWDQGAVQVRDAGAVLRAGPGCVAEDQQAVRCTAGKVEADLGDGDDRLLALPEASTTVDGGEGADVLEAAPEAFARFEGGPGDDLLVGGDRGNVLDGGLGADRLLGGKGGDYMTGDPPEGPPSSDVLQAGDGLDSASYQYRRDGVVVDLTGRPPGGAGGPEDLVTGVERLTGSSGDDVLRGTSAYETIFAGPGDDVVEGGGGDDYLLGQEGVNVVDGGDGDDIIAGGGDGNTLIGGAGDDVIGGGRGDGARLRDLSCGQGEDFLSSLPGGDFLPDDCELLELRSFRTSYPRMIDGHPRFDLTRRPDNPVSCRVRVEVRTMGGRLLARGAKRTDNRAARVTAVLTATGRALLRGRATPLRAEMAFRRASCRGSYGAAGRFAAQL